MQTTTTYTIIDCPECNVLFAITDQFEERRRADGNSFYCPSGHSMSYGDSLKDQLRRAKDANARLTSRLDQVKADRDQTELRRRAAVGQATKIRKRIANGVCPCCNRSFADLARHMQSKHPEYAANSKAVSPNIGTAA